MYIYKGVACMYICERLHSGMMLHIPILCAFFQSLENTPVRCSSVAGKVYFCVMRSVTGRMLTTLVH